MECLCELSLELHKDNDLHHSILKCKQITDEKSSKKLPTVVEIKIHKRPGWYSMVAGKYVVNQSEQAIGSDAAQVCFDIPLPKFKIVNLSFLF